MGRALAALGVRADETVIVAWVAALFFVTQASHGLGANTADALFFERFGVEFLPAMILISGFIVMGALLVYIAGLSSWGAARWLWPVPLVFAGWLVLERVGIAADLASIYPVVWQSAQVIIMVTFTLMWNAAGEVCTTRQAKRLFPIFASAGIAGGIVGNAITGPAASVLGTENVLILQAGLLGLAGLLTFGTAQKLFASERPAPTTSVIADLRTGFDLTVRTPLLRLVAATAVLFAVLFYFVVFPFSEAVAESFDTEAEIAGYLGLFSSLATAATFAVSLFVANRLFSRFGVVAALLVVPIVYVAGFSLWLVAFGLVTASLIRAAQWIAVNALGGTAWSSLFNVLTGRRRGQVMAFVAAVPAQLGTVLSGLLLVLGRDLPDAARLAISLVVAVAALLLVLRMRPAYGAALVTAVERGLVDVFTTATAGVAKPALDADALRALENGLRDSRPARRRVAATMLGRVGNDQAIALLHSQLGDEDPSVRTSTLDALAEARDPDLVGHATVLLDDSEAAVRLRACHHLLSAGTRPSWDATRLERDPDPRVRAAAARLAGGPEGEDVVATLLADQDPTAMTAGLEALAEGFGPEGVDLAPFADHSDRLVRIAAARAMGQQAGNEATLKHLLDDVSPAVRQTAAQALAADGGSAHVLLDVLATGSVRATEAALGGMSESTHRQELHDWIEGELQRAALLRRYRLSVDNEQSADGHSLTRRYLVRVLSARQRRLERWIMQALSIGDATPYMSTVSRGAWSDDAETRSQALEALESIADRDVARPLIAMLEGEATDMIPNGRAALRDLSHDFDPWLRALAVRCLSEELLDDITRVQSAAEHDESELVRSATPAWTSHLRPRRTLDTLDRVLALQQVPLFGELDPEELQLIAAVTTESSFSAGQTVYEAGATGDEMIVLIEGSVDVRTGGSDGRVIATRAAGEHVGELAVLRHRPRMADVVAGAAGARGLTVRGEDLRSILEERPEVAMAMLGTLADRIGELPLG